MALLGITPQPFDEFYAFVNEGSEIRIDVKARKVVVTNGDNEQRDYGFELSQMEERLISGGGVTSLYDNYGSDLFRVLMLPNNGNDGLGGNESSHADGKHRPLKKAIGDFVDNIMPKLKLPVRQKQKVNNENCGGGNSACNQAEAQW